MKFVRSIFCLAICLYMMSCTDKEKSSHTVEINGILVDTSIIKIDTRPYPIVIDREQPDFVIDSTLKRLYPDDILKFGYTPSRNWKRGEVKTAEEAFSIVKPSFLEICNGDINLNKPFRINLIDDKIWIIYGSPQPGSGIVFGGDLYVEILKNSGAISAIIVGE